MSPATRLLPRYALWDLPAACRVLQVAEIATRPSGCRYESRWSKSSVDSQLNTSASGASTSIPQKAKIFFEWNRNRYRREIRSSYSTFHLACLFFVFFVQGNRLVPRLCCCSKPTPFAAGESPRQVLPKSYPLLHHILRSSFVHSLRG